MTRRPGRKKLPRLTRMLSGTMRQTNADVKAGRLDPERLVTLRSAMAKVEQAHELLASASREMSAMNDPIGQRPSTYQVLLGRLILRAGDVGYWRDTVERLLDRIDKKEER